MTQYINKNEVEKILGKLWREDDGYNSEHRICYNKALDEVQYELDTLEVKEVDLEKEYKDFIKNDNGRSMFETAKHFFELGLKVKQESNDEVKIGETQIYLEDDGGEPPYEGKQWLDLSCMEYEIPKDLFKDGDNVEIFIRKVQKGE